MQRLCPWMPFSSLSGACGDHRISGPDRLMTSKDRSCLVSDPRTRSGVRRRSRVGVPRQQRQRKLNKVR